MKAFADDKIDVVKLVISLLVRVENTVRKGENAFYQHFLFSPPCFPRPSFSGHYKSELCSKEYIPSKTNVFRVILESACLSIRLFIHVFLCVCIRLYTKYLSVCPYVPVYVYPSVYKIPVCLSICPCICVSVCVQNNCLPDHLSLYLCIRLCTQ